MRPLLLHASARSATAASCTSNTPASPCPKACTGTTRRRRTRLAVDFQAAGVQRYCDETETHLFRIAQEAFTNIARHSAATAAIPPIIPRAFMKDSTLDA